MMNLGIENGLIESQYIKLNKHGSKTKNLHIFCSLSNQNVSANGELIASLHP
jgi:hypothetical protein